MQVDDVYFVGSFPKESMAPKDGKPEFAFIGRSNVGKSSLINMLLGRKGMAKTSGKPGKTQYLNYFVINKQWYIVDLPGYGYAKISKLKRRHWEQMIQRYLKTREMLVVTFVLIDSRHELQLIDQEFIDWMGEIKVPFVIVFTKVDKLKPIEAQKNITAIKDKLLEHWEFLPECFETSATTGAGRDELLEFINDVNKSISLQ